MSNVPKLRFKEFSGEWQEKKIGKIGNFFSGGTPTSSNKSYYDGSIPFIGSGKIGSVDVEQFITEKALNNSSAKIIEVGDLLYALYGATSGEVAISKIKGAINQAVLCIRTDENKIFLKTWLEKNKERILSTYLQGGQGNLSAQIVKSLKINLPSKQEQEKIASFLTSVDTKIEQLAKKETLLEQYKKGVMQKIFNQEIRFKADDGSMFPEWEEKKLEDVIDFENGKAHEQNIVERSDYIVVNSKFISSNGSVVKYSDTLINPLYKSDIVMVMSDVPKGKALAKCYLIEEDNKYTLNQRICALHQKDCNNRYLFYIINRNKYYLAFDSGVGQTNLKKNEVLDLPLTLPCVEEQTKIANFLSSIDTKIEQVQNKLKQTKEFKKALLQQMFV